MTNTSVANKDFSPQGRVSFQCQDIVVLATGRASGHVRNHSPLILWLSGQGNGFLPGRLAFDSHPSETRMTHWWHHNRQLAKTASMLPMLSVTHSTSQTGFSWCYKVTPHWLVFNWWLQIKLIKNSLLTNAAPTATPAKPIYNKTKLILLI